MLYTLADPAYKVFYSSAENQRLKTMPLGSYKQCLSALSYSAIEILFSHLASFGFVLCYGTLLHRV